MTTLTVKACKCKHDFQDQTYGKGNRLHTISKKDGTERCTVCGPAARKTQRVHLHALEYKGK